MSYLAKRGSTYYFRRVVPDDLQPIIGKREIMVSLRTKDRETAKRLIPTYILSSDRQFEDARNSVAVAPVPLPVVRSQAQLQRDRARWEFEQEQAEFASAAAQARDDELDELSPVMDAIDAGIVPNASPEQIARAGKLLAINERETAEIAGRKALDRMFARYGSRETQLASEPPDQIGECENGNTKAPRGKGIYLDTEIVGLWAKERSPAAKTKDGYRRVAEWLHERVGRKSAELYTRADILTFKDKLLGSGPIDLR